MSKLIKKTFFEVLNSSSFCYNFFLENNLKDYNNLIITENSTSSYEIFNELKNFYQDKNKILIFEDLEILPYDEFSPSLQTLSKRVEVLNIILQNPKNLIIISQAKTLLKYLPSIDFLFKYSFSYKEGDILNLNEFIKKIANYGYKKVNQVKNFGEFSLRGSILDIFPLASQYPIRVDFFDNEIESLRYFDKKSQRTFKKVKEINIFPKNEIILDDYALENFNLNYPNIFSKKTSNFEQSNIYKNIKEKNYFDGISFYLNLFSTKKTSIFDYFKKNKTKISTFGNINFSITDFYKNLQQRFENLNLDKSKFLLPINYNYLGIEEFFKHLKEFQTDIYNLQENDIFLNIPKISYDFNQNNPLEKLQDFLKKTALKKIIFVAQNNQRLKVLSEYLDKISLQNLNAFDDFNTSLKSKSKYIFLISNFNNGFIYKNKFALICEKNLFPFKIHNYENTKKTLKKVKKVHQENSINEIFELKENDYVVHINHGIGIYKGLSVLDVGNNKKEEFLAISYANNESIFIPLSSINLLSKYQSAKDNIKINSLGTNKWNVSKEKAKTKIYDMASELLEIYAKREEKEGFKYILDEDYYNSFCEGFPFIETEDQEKAIKETLEDMEQKKPMDRLVCGDVGFGKTEIALRACFMAVSNSKQVIVLVPTTLLAEQHFNNFYDRFINFAINVESLSRFKSKKKKEEILKNLENGSIDIIIGTHSLLNDKIKFKNLGLLVIDEEHKFGVKHKEKIKSLKSNIDILTMTATPIPRTLNLAFSNVRDLSIIASPPLKRLAIKTIVKNYNNETIKEAVNREILRGGQIYYVYNSVQKIYYKKEILEDLFKNLKIKIAHGGLKGSELENIMFSFQNKEFDILLCTTIIENGIDISNVNTIIIENADNFGLAQLHQLRGRVGRSNHQAYAYLLVEDLDYLKSDAKKRLEAIKKANNLGAGFEIAKYDLEIRGIGDILGKEQSGHIENIGFSLYLKLLEKTVNLLKKNKNLIPLSTEYKKEDIEIDLSINALIPEFYINDVYTRLSFYQKLSNANTYEELLFIKDELQDRFGKIDIEIENLIIIYYFKQLCLNASIKKIIMHRRGGSITFFDLKNNTNFNINKLMKVIQKYPNYFKITKDTGYDKLIILKSFNEEKLRINFIKVFLENITK